MILKASDRAMSDLAARTELRCAYLWQQLDEIQEQMSALVHLPNHRPVTGPWFDMDDFRTLADRERQILRQIDEVDS